jgi:hypothetical protein
MELEDFPEDSIDATIFEKLDPIQKAFVYYVALQTTKLPGPYKGKVERPATVVPFASYNVDEAEEEIARILVEKFPEEYQTLVNGPYRKQFAERATHDNDIIQVEDQQVKLGEVDESGIVYILNIGFSQIGESLNGKQITIFSQGKGKLGYCEGELYTISDQYRKQEEQKLETIAKTLCE